MEGVGPLAPFLSATKQRPLELCEGKMRNYKALGQIQKQRPAYNRCAFNTAII